MSKREELNKLRPAFEALESWEPDGLAIWFPHCFWLLTNEKDWDVFREYTRRLLPGDGPAPVMEREAPDRYPVMASYTIETFSCGPDVILYGFLYALDVFRLSMMMSNVYLTEHQEEIDAALRGDKEE